MIVSSSVNTRQKFAARTWRQNVVSAYPIHGLLGFEPSLLRVLLETRNEVHDRLAPPVRHKPLRRLGKGALGRHQLDVAALILPRVWLHEVLDDIVQIHGAYLARLVVYVKPPGDDPILICEAVQLVDLELLIRYLRLRGEGNSSSTCNLQLAKSNFRLSKKYSSKPFACGAALKDTSTKIVQTPGNLR